jgi:uncharacterized protein YciW
MKLLFVTDGPKVQDFSLPLHTKAMVRATHPAFLTAPVQLKEAAAVPVCWRGTESCEHFLPRHSPLLSGTSGHNQTSAERNNSNLTLGSRALCCPVSVQELSRTNQV